MSKLIDYLRIREGWLSLIALAMMVFATTWSLEKAAWVNGLDVLGMVALYGLALGFVLAVLRPVPAVLAHLLAAVLGSGVILLQWSTMLPEDLQESPDRLQFLLNHSAKWFWNVYGGGIVDDPLMLVGGLAVVVWIMGYLCAWSVFRRHRTWLAMGYPVLTFLINASYVASPSRFYFVVLIAGALVLFARMNAVKNEERWRQFGLRFSRVAVWRVVWSGFVVCAAVLLVANFVPAAKASPDPLSSVMRAFGGPLSQIDLGWGQNLWPFGTGTGAMINTSYTNFSSAFEVGGNISLGDDEVLRVKADKSSYMQAMAYDTYSGRGWENTTDESFRLPDGQVPKSQSLDPLSPLLALGSDTPLPSEYLDRSTLTQTIHLLRPNSDAVIAAGDIISVTKPTNLVPSWEWRRYRDMATTGPETQAAPRELQNLLSLLHNPDGGRKEYYDITAIRHEMSTLADKGIVISEIQYSERDGITGFNASGMFAEYKDITSVRFSERPRAGDSYAVVSSVAEPNPESLKSASTDYPEWIKRRYLALPEQFPARITELTQTLTKDKSSVYDKALAIETFLRTFKYAEAVNTPPPGRDVVDYFLFEGKQGYCEYFSSSMAVMLRSIGIPSRVVTGFNTGELDSTTGDYVVRERNAHAWPQVYFPSYGWIDFEPTPSQPTVTTAEPEVPAAEASPTVPGGETMRDFPRFSFDPSTLPSGSPERTFVESVQGVVSSKAFQIPAGLLVLAAAAVLGLLAAWHLGLRDRGPVALAFARISQAAQWLGVRSKPSTTPRESVSALSRVLPEVSRPLQAIGERYMEEAYGPERGDGSDAPSLEPEWNQVKPIFVRRLIKRPVEAALRVIRRK